MEDVDEGGPFLAFCKGRVLTARAASTLQATYPWRTIAARSRFEADCG